jgi:hypothetical protein
MSAPASAFVTYLWHYVVARLLYDDLVHPLSRGQFPTTFVLVAVAVGVVFGVTRRGGRRT